MAISPDGKIEAWKKSDFRERVTNCRAMLHIHGFLTDAENANVSQRIRKWIEKHEKNK